RRVYVTGCGANLAGRAFAGLPDNVVVVAKRSEETPDFVAGHVGAIGCVQADARFDRVRAFVKVQDGCSFSCNFCVIPLVRGASRSRRAAAVLREIERRVAQGHREVVLTGINLGCFRDRADGYDLPRLVREGGETPGLDRLRLSSIEINHVDAGLTKVHVFPYSPRPGTLTAGDDRISAAVKKERGARLRALSHGLCLRRWESKIGALDSVLVDRPGRGYGDDYSPWLVDAPVGELVRVRAAAVTDEGILAA